MELLIYYLYFRLPTVIAIGWGIVGLFAFLVALTKCKERSSLLRTLAVLTLIFVLPQAWWWGRGPYAEYIAKRDYAVFQELCAKYAGDKIIRRVENVEGVLQMRARDPSPETTHQRNQFAMEDPFGALGDVGSGFGTSAFLSGERGRTHYEFFETPKSLSAVNQGPYIRYSLERGQFNARGEPKLETVRREVDTALSKYGYLWTDLSDEGMRRRWIARGRIQVFDLASGELIAERIGLVFAKHLNGELNLYPWSGGFTTCPPMHRTSNFIRSVLVPKN